MGTSTSHTSNYVNFVRQYFTIKVSQEIPLKVFRVLHSLKQSLTNSIEPNLIEHSCYFTSLILYVTVSSNISQGITEANLLPFLSKYRGLPVFHCPPFYIHTVVRCTNDCGLQLSPSALSPTSFPRSLDRSLLYFPWTTRGKKYFRMLALGEVLFSVRNLFKSTGAAALRCGKKESVAKKHS